MSYYFAKTLSTSFEAAESKAREELKKEGFGVLTELDVKETLKQKLNVEFKRYKILGACNPPFAHQALVCWLPRSLILWDSSMMNKSQGFKYRALCMRKLSNPTMVK